MITPVSQSPNPPTRTQAASLSDLLLATRLVVDDRDLDLLDACFLLDRAVDQFDPDTEQAFRIRLERLAERNPLREEITTWCTEVLSETVSACPRLSAIHKLMFIQLINASSDPKSWPGLVGMYLSLVDGVPYKTAYETFKRWDTNAPAPSIGRSASRPERETIQMHNL